MKRIALLVFLVLAPITRADLTIVQRVEMGGTPGDMTIRMKGDHVRIDPAPEMSLITNNKTGDTVTLVHAEKKALRMSGEKMRAAAEMVSKFAGSGATPGTQRPKIAATGRTEEVNGMATEVYTADTPVGKATYYIARNYPDGSAIMKEMQAAQPAALANSSTNMPDFRDLPGVPVRIETDSQGRHVVMTLVSIKRDPIPDSQFLVPPDYNEMKMPAIFGGKNAPAADSATPKVSGQPQITPIPRPTP